MHRRRVPTLFFSLYRSGRPFPPLGPGTYPSLLFLSAEGPIQPFSPFWRGTGHWSSSQSTVLSSPPGTGKGFPFSVGKRPPSTPGKKYGQSVFSFADRWNSSLSNATAPFLQGAPFLVLFVSSVICSFFPGRGRLRSFFWGRDFLSRWTRGRNQLFSPLF